MQGVAELFYTHPVIKRKHDWNTTVGHGSVSTLEMQQAYVCALMPLMWHKETFNQ